MRDVAEIVTGLGCGWSRVTSRSRGVWVAKSKVRSDMAMRVAAGLLREIGPYQEEEWLLSLTGVGNPFLWRAMLRSERGGKRKSQNLVVTWPQALRRVRLGWNLTFC